MGERACYCVCAFLTLVAGAPDTPNSWLRPQPQQTLPALMVSVEQQLRTLDFTKWEATLKQLEQRINSLESSFHKLDMSFKDRLDKLELNLNSKELKDELMAEKLSLKVRDVVDTGHNRYNQRLGFAEDRLEISLKKAQMSLETVLARVEKNQDDVQAEVLEAVAILKDLKSQSTTTEVKLNSTHKAIQQHIQSLITPNNEELQRISGTLENLGSRLNNSIGVYSNQSDGSNINDVVTSFRKEINAEGTKFTNKANIMYNDLWRRIVSVESMVKDLKRSANATHRDVLEEIRSLVESDHKDSSGDSQENFMLVFLDAVDLKLQNKFSELGQKINDRMDSLNAGQNLMIDSCFDEGVCGGLESRLSQVLERIFEVVSDKIDNYTNRTFDLNKLVKEMMELVKNQHSQLIRTVTHNTNMVMTLGKENNETDKKLHSSILQLAEKTNYNFQELHDEVQEIANTGGKACLEADKTNEDIIDNQKPFEVPQKNLTEMIVITTLNSTKPEKNSTKNYQDVGVLKILTDDIQPLGDNGNLNSPKLSKLEFNSVKNADSSAMQVLSLISPNLTRNQLESLLKFLNSSVNLERVEAIIQNTEADIDDDTLAEASSLEAFETYLPSKTNAEEENGLKSGSREKPFIGNSNELENTEEASSDLDHLDLPETAIPQNTSNSAENTSSISIARNDTNVLDLPDNLKEPLQVYVVLMKIKHENFNISQLWEKTEQNTDKSENNSSKVLLPVLQKICYGEKNVEDVSTEFMNNAMRRRLLLIRQTIIEDKKLYEKIENVCNTMTESLLIQNNRKVTLPYG